MKDEKKDERRCANEGCQRFADEDSLVCSECNLEWSLFHREVRIEDTSACLPVPVSDAPVSLA